MFSKTGHYDGMWRAKYKKSSKNGAEFALMDEMKEQGPVRSSGCAVKDGLEAPASSPGTHLPGYRTRENLTQDELARLVGIPRGQISEMENDKRPIGGQNAQKLADFFGTDPRMFLPA